MTDDPAKALMDAAFKALAPDPFVEAGKKLSTIGDGPRDCPHDPLLWMQECHLCIAEYLRERFIPAPRGGGEARDA